MKKILLGLLLLLSLKGIGQAVIAPTGNVAPAGNFPAFYDEHFKGGYRVVADTNARNAILGAYRKDLMLVGDTTTKTVWLLDSSRNPMWVRFGGFDPSLDETITAGLWQFPNKVQIGGNEASGVWNYLQQTVVGDWSGNGDIPNTYLFVDASSGTVQSWGGAFQVWGILDGNDYATANAAIGSNGSFYTDGGAIHSDGSGNLMTSGGYQCSYNGSTANATPTQISMNDMWDDYLYLTYDGVSAGYYDEYGENFCAVLSSSGVGGSFNDPSGDNNQWSIGNEGIAISTNSTTFFNVNETGDIVSQGSLTLNDWADGYSIAIGNNSTGGWAHSGNWDLNDDGSVSFDCAAFTSDGSGNVSTNTLATSIFQEGVYTAPKWKLGCVNTADNSLSLNTSNYVTVNIDGETYDLATVNISTTP